MLTESLVLGWNALACFKQGDEPLPEADVGVEAELFLGKGLTLGV